MLKCSTAGTQLRRHRAEQRWAINVHLCERVLDLAVDCAQLLAVLLHAAVVRIHFGLPQILLIQCVRRLCLRDLAHHVAEILCRGLGPLLAQ